MSETDELTEVVPLTEMEIEAKLVDLFNHSLTAAKFYTEKPGLAGAETIIDIYKTIGIVIHVLQEMRVNARS